MAVWRARALIRDRYRGGSMGYCRGLSILVTICQLLVPALCSRQMSQLSADSLNHVRDPPRGSLEHTGTPHRVLRAESGGFLGASCPPGSPVEGVGNHIFRTHSAGLHLFAAMSTYRSGRNSFATVGVSSAVAMEHLGLPADSCVWESLASGSTRVETTANVVLLGGAHNRRYETVIVICKFGSDVGADGSGGLLYIVKDKTEEDLLVHHEAPGGFSIVEQKPRYEVAFCGPPMHGEVHPRIIRDWFEYHDAVLGAGQYFLYDYGGVSEDVAAVLRPYAEAGKVTMTRVEREHLYDAWYFHQTANINDCLYRTRFVARWVFFFDFDEFLYLPPPRMRLAEVLQGLEGYAWSDLGNVHWDVRHCLDNKGQEEESALERMVWRCTAPFCEVDPHQKTHNFTAKDVCPEHLGRRKYVVDPMLTDSVKIHMPLNATGEARHWNASVYSTDPKIYHFHGLLSVPKSCTVPRNKNQKVLKYASGESYVVDMALASKVKDIRRRRNESSPPPPTT